MSKNFLIAVYFSHDLPVLSYKNLRLCRESLMILEYHQNIWNYISVYNKESKRYKIFGVDLVRDASDCGSVGLADWASNKTCT